MSAVTHTIVGFGPYGARECSCGERFTDDGALVGAQLAAETHIANPPTGMGPKQAIRLVAQHVLASAARDENAIDWGSYPEIGEHDWSRVIDKLDDIAPWPDPDEYREAYAFLESRADGAA